jgi:hypothetical protein
MQILINIMNTLLLPFYFVWFIFRFIYNIVFFIPITLSTICENIMGDSFFCRIMNPDYIFTNTIFNLLSWIIVVYLFINIRNAYLEWKNKKMR